MHEFRTPSNRHNHESGAVCAHLGRDQTPCEMQMPQTNATADFLGDETRWPAARIELNDVQALWGGRRIVLQGSGRAVVRVLQRGGSERRYEFELSTAEARQFLERFVENDFLTIQPRERPGIPDESRPRITLVNAAQQEWSVAKWAGVEEGRFDDIYAALLRLEKSTGHLEPVYSGPSESGS